MLVKKSKFGPRALAEFRRLQQLSFSILEKTASSLAGGETEQEVGRALVKQYRTAGAESFFHLPVVLFGERTALPGEWPIKKFFPKKTTLSEGDSVIMDAAPLFNGYLVDTSYSFCFGRDARHRDMMAFLSAFRNSVPDAINAGATFREAALQVEHDMLEAGYEPVHNKHPGEVLGHRAIKTARLPFKPRMQGFDALSLGWFKLTDQLSGWRLARQSPLWNTSDASDHKAHDGLWLVEPHAGCDDVGAKWEEILLIENGKARWLDEQPPHLWQWQQIAARQDYAPREFTA